METAFCIEAVEEALVRYSKPDIFNTDQGSQFTSIDFTAVLKKAVPELDPVREPRARGTSCAGEQDRSSASDPPIAVCITRNCASDNTSSG